MYHKKKKPADTFTEHHIVIAFNNQLLTVKRLVEPSEKINVHPHNILDALTQHAVWSTLY